MIETQFGKLIFICDECGDDFDTGLVRDHFLEALQTIKEEGWTVKRNDDDTEWMHICNECAGGRK